MKIIGGIVLIVGIISFFIIAAFKRKLSTKKYLLESWGSRSKRIYDAEDLEDISNYYRLKVKYQDTNTNIDSTTWNDLDMDSVFGTINSTITSIGDEYLYDKLHHLSYDKDEMMQFEELLDCINRNEEVRIQIQMYLSNLGRVPYNNAASYIFELENKEIDYSFIYKILGWTPLGAIAGFFIDIQLGVFLLIAAFITNMAVHYKLNKRFIREFTPIRHLASIVECAKNLSKIEEQHLKEVISELSINYNKLKKICSAAGHFMLNGAMELDAIREYISILFLYDLNMYNKILKALRDNPDSLHKIFHCIGMLDTAIAVASYRKSLQYWCTPNFCETPVLQIVELYHPLLENPVSNTVTIDKNVIITGSNASGKSTFVKALAINGILAQTIHTCLAKEYTAKLAYYATSMAVRDNILTSESYFIAEIRSLKRILDYVNKEIYCICFIDEILKGTNTNERIAASAAILKYLADKQCLCLVASHDIELTQILKNIYENYHFREKIDLEGIHFDYKIYAGASNTRNAIKLLEFMEYNFDITSTANRLADEFKINHSWETI